MERRREVMIVAAASLAGALTRLLAISKTAWDWDEALFMLALRHYDVVAHHPHPPGFPLFIFFAKGIAALGVDDFRALQAIVVASSMLIVPAAYSFARALKLEFATSLTAAILLAFFPNVWFYGGTAFSDVPSMVLVVAACALLLHERTYFLGALLLGFACGMRPQNLLIGFAPLLLGARRDLRRVIAAAAIVAVVVVTSYGAAAQLSGGWREYADAIARHQRYIRETDSVFSPIRPPIYRSFDDFYIRPYAGPLIYVPLTLFVLAGLVRVKRHAVLLATFAPFALFAWLMLDRFSVSRFSIGYAPLMAILAADGIALVARRAAPAIAAVLVAIMIVWTSPSLTIVRTTESPTYAAAMWIRAHYDLRTTSIDADDRVRAFADYWLTDAARDAKHVVVMREGVLPNAQVFARPHEPLWRLVRQRYFEISVVP